MSSKEIQISRSGGVSEILEENNDKAIEFFVNASNEIAFALVKYRKANGLTQTDLANKLGFSQAMVSKLESCEYNFTIELLSNICAKLDWDFKVVPEPVSLTVKIQNYTPITMKSMKLGESASYHYGKWPAASKQAVGEGDEKIA